ncbi:MAG: 50S ribosomal protein L11 methyltransferase [SAR202 cluster bacterium]|nr:50S ribosomal protein L11 methyltransferase [SAR202 cluster bacterium]
MTQKSWVEFKVKVAFEYVEPIAELFKKYGKDGIVIEHEGGWNPDEGESPPLNQSAILKTYIPKSPAFKTNLEMLHIGIQLIGKLTNLEIYEEKQIKEHEWEEAWKAHFTPLKIGKKIIVQPPWHQLKTTEDNIVIEIDPGLAFGTGHHPTTMRTLQCLEELIKPEDNVVDVGSGSGILSIGAAKLGAAKVLGVEIDPVAVKAGRENLIANAVSGKVRFYTGSLPNENIPFEWSDLTLANVNSLVLTQLGAELNRSLKSTGILVASGILFNKLDEVVSAFAQNKLYVAEQFQDDDWVTLVLKKI